MTQLTETPRVGVALIGARMIAPTHVAALSAARTRIRLEAIVSRRPERAHYLAELHAGSAPLFTSELSAVVENPDVQLAIVGTPFPQGRETITLNCEHGTLRLGADTLDISWCDGRCEQATPGTGHAGEGGVTLDISNLTENN